MQFEGRKTLARIQFFYDGVVVVAASGHVAVSLAIVVVAVTAIHIRKKMRSNFVEIKKNKDKL